MNSGVVLSNLLWQTCECRKCFQTQVDFECGSISLPVVELPDPREVYTTLQPKPHIGNLEIPTSLNGTKIGVFWDFFNDSEPLVRETCSKGK